MSWIHDGELNWFHRLLVNIMKAGPIPYHIAFIMDGNRRFATKSKKRKVEGHSMGFDKLSEVLKWCLLIGINEVTVYAFSIENYKRNVEEVETLMSLARDKFKQLIDEQDKLHEKGIRINVIGNISMLPKDLQKSIADAMIATRNNKKAILNVAISYTSRDEITHSIKTIVQGIENNEIKVEDVSEDLISECLYTRGGRDPDLLVRTSGESRLSDFLLWQSSSSVLYFTEALWPEFGLYHLLAGIFVYQRSYTKMSEVRNSLNKSKQEFTGDENRVNKFIEKLNERHYKYLLKLSNNSPVS